MPGTGAEFSCCKTHVRNNSYAPAKAGGGNTGDREITGDKFFFNKGIALSSDTSSFNNIWDSQLPVGLVPGIDIDTFSINYPTLVAGDTEAHIDYLGIDEDPDQYYSASDGFTPIYVILSFRSEVTTGGTLDYLLEF